MKRLYDWFFPEPEPTEEEKTDHLRVMRVTELGDIYEKLLPELGREPTIAEIWAESDRV